MQVGREEVMGYMAGIVACGLKLIAYEPYHIKQNWKVSQVMRDTNIMNLNQDSGNGEKGLYLKSNLEEELTEFCDMDACVG